MDAPGVSPACTYTMSERELDGRTVRPSHAAGVPAAVADRGLLPEARRPPGAIQ